MDESFKEKITNSNLIKKYLSSGTLLTVHLKNDFFYKAEKSKIEYSQEKYFTIPAPFKSDSSISLKKGTILFFKVSPPSGYYIETASRIIGFYSTALRSYTNIVYPPYVLRIQRRLSYRVPISLTALVTWGIGFEKREEMVTILDLSLGGALIASNSVCSVDERGLLRFSIPERPFLVQLEFTVRRVQKISSKKSRFNFHYGINFSYVPDIMSQEMSRFITWLQIQSRK